jgi:ribosome-associated protein
MEEIEITFARSGGPGGQNANKVNTKAVLRFSLAESPSIPEPARRRAMTVLAGQLTKHGELVLHCDTYRAAERNRTTGLERLAATIAAAVRKPKRRRATVVSRAQREKRLHEKRQRGEEKKRRTRPSPDD